MREFFLTTIALFLFFGCSSSKKAKLELANNSFVKTVIEERFDGKPVETTYNPDRDFVIIINRIERGVGYPAVISFVVVDLLKKKTVYTETISDGAVSWLNNDTVLIKRVPGAKSIVEEENQNAKRTELNVREL